MSSGPIYVCPMHADVRQAGAGKCPHCKMDLVPEGAKFGILRHMAGNPLHLAVMVVVMVVLMALAMMMLK
jgi:hypothetical protein